ncbi:hypothetical protein CP532_5024 [Ophiocordyceps camponoti-leonardi (nom. inval.)]|nr:hypothetical protein CP532_5024 [Ophiocordyceps camponoti-leonardi (nom. inval.)]
MAGEPSAMDKVPHRDVAHLREQYQASVHEQVQRIYGTYQAPLWARVFGWSRDRRLEVIEDTALGFATYAQTPISDEQLQAIGEECNFAADGVIGSKLLGVGVSAYLAYRGRKTFRFPFFTPKGEGFWNPRGATPFNRTMWHMARFGSYYVLFGMFVGQPLAMYATLTAMTSVEKHPCMSELLERGRELQKSRPKGESPWISPPRQKPITEEAFMEEERSIAEQARSGWRTSSQQDSWNQVLDDTDDASPVSPSSSRYDAGNGGGSAWDRVRHQSLGGQSGQQSRQRRDTWNVTRGDKADRDSRGIESSGERRGRETYSFSSSDGDKAVAKSQSQEEFDMLLERERHGIDQETSSGRRN